MKITNLKKKIGDFSLNIESMDIPMGEIYGIIGSNGCGKTTLMKIIAGVLTPDSGHINYGSLTARDITMVFRKPYLLHDTVIHNLLYPLTLRKIKPDMAQVEYFLETAGLQNCRKQYAPGLSGGQQQKLALIRAMIFSPKLILIDEAFSNLDMESTDVFERLIIERQRLESTTVLICSHQLSQVQRMCGHVFSMKNGSVEKNGIFESRYVGGSAGKINS